MLAFLVLPLFGLPFQGGPIISEFQAINDHVLADAAENYSDWLEIYNPGAAVDLGGWFLTDDDANLQKWEFPIGTLLASGAFLLVFASDEDAVLNGELHTNFKLAGGGEYLALVEPDGVTIAHEYYPEYPPQSADISYGIRFPPNPPLIPTYFSQATPGAANSFGEPIVLEMEASPGLPAFTDNIVVEAEIVFPPNTQPAFVDLVYRVSYQAESQVSMADDGLGSDQVAGDSIWTGTIPAGVANPLKMLRWRVVAEDGNGAVGLHPPFVDPLGSPQYGGTVIEADTVASEIPVIHLFCESNGQSQTTSGSQSSVLYNGQFYDNILVKRRGASSSTWPKKSFKFDFNRGDRFRFSEGGNQVSEFNVNSTWSDKAFLRQTLAFETYEAADANGCLSFMVRLNRGGNFFALAAFVEQPDEDLLSREGLDPEGALYKMFTDLSQLTQYSHEKKTRLWENDADLQDLAVALQASGTELERWLFDNMNIPAVLAYLAATVVINDNDHVAKNYYLYRDSDGDQEWEVLPWDKDLTLGRNFVPASGGVLNDDIWVDQDPQSHPLFGDRNHISNASFWNRLIDAFYRVPRIQEMFLRHLRTVMDDTLQSPQIPASELKFEARIDALVTECLPELQLDQAKWGIPDYGDTSMDYAQAVAILKSEYFAKRRIHLYETHGPSGSGLVPNAQEYPYIALGQIDHSPVSGNQEEEFVQLVNLNTFAVDVSGWTLGGGVSMEIPAGSVIAAKDNLYLARSAQDFRARTVAPKGGMSLLVIGDYEGHISPTEDIHLFDNQGDLVATTGGLVAVPRNFVAGETAHCSILQGTPNGFVSLVYSLAGAGSTPTPWGDLGLAPPVRLAGQERADMTGQFEFTALLPATMTGKTVWIQAVDMSSHEFSEVVEVSIP